MKGKIEIRVSNRNVQYKFTLIRNITVIRGNSGTGKTTLFDMIADYTRLGTESGVTVVSSVPCVALTDLDWENQLRQTENSVVFIDEGFKPVVSQDFAAAVKNTGNYYVFFYREPLRELPYSVEEIYEIKTSGKYHSLIKMNGQFA